MIDKKARIFSSQNSQIKSHARHINPSDDLQYYKPTGEKWDRIMSIDKSHSGS